MQGDRRIRPHFKSGGSAVLNVCTLENARNLIEIFCRARENESERVPLERALKRVLRQDIVCLEDVPCFTRSSVDGYAVAAEDTFGASASMPALLRLAGEVRMGQSPAFTLQSGECAAVPTGGQLPEGADAMVMLEEAEAFAGGVIAVEASVAPGKHLIFAGDDAKKGQIVLNRGTVLTTRGIGALAALGYAEVEAAKRPRVCVLSTGDELVDPAQTPVGAEVRDVNGVMLTAAATQAGAEAAFCGRVPDDADMLNQKVSACCGECDILLISGGSSVGVKDAAANCVSSLGELLFHGLAVKPGKPAFAGTIGKTLVLGLPGHPTAAYFVFELLARPAIYALLGQTAREFTVLAKLNAAVPSNTGREEYVAVRLEEGTAEPLMSKSGLISVLSRADGYIRISRDAEGFAKGASVEVHLF